MPEQNNAPAIAGQRAKEAGKTKTVAHLVLAKASAEIGNTEIPAHYPSCKPSQ